MGDAKKKARAAGRAQGLNVGGIYARHQAAAGRMPSIDDHDLGFWAMMISIYDPTLTRATLRADWLEGFGEGFREAAPRRLIVRPGEA